MNPDITDGSEFYIGWQSKSQAGPARRSRKFFVAVLVVTSVSFFLAARFQSPIDPGAFEFGVERTFEGTVVESPLPMLQVPGKDDWVFTLDREAASGINCLLVGSGKFGASDVVRGKGGNHIRFAGSLIHRNGVAMIEVNKPESLEVTQMVQENASRVVSLGRSTFVGELVDTKCFLGVMRPATGKVHRGCAVRCLSGGAPSALLA